MTDNTSGSYVVDVMYHDHLIVESAEVSKLTTTAGFLRLDEPLPVGTALKLKFRKASGGRSGPVVAATVLHVFEASSKEGGEKTGIDVTFLDDGPKTLEALLQGTWVPADPSEAEPAVQAPPAPPAYKPTHPDEAPDELEDSSLLVEEEVRPPAVPPPLPEATAARSEELPDDQDGETYQKASTMQGVPVMTPPDAEDDVVEGDAGSDDDEQKTGRSRKRKRSKRKRKKDS